VEETAYGLYQRGAALLSEGMAHEAAASLERARDMEPEKASIRESLARAYYALGRTVAARDEFSAAAGIDPSNDYAHFGLALCLEREGRIIEARGHAKLAVAMRPENEDYRRALERIERSVAR